MIARASWTGLWPTIVAAFGVETSTADRRPPPRRRRRSPAVRLVTAVVGERAGQPRARLAARVRSRRPRRSRTRRRADRQSPAGSLAATVIVTLSPSGIGPSSPTEAMTGGAFSTSRPRRRSGSSAPRHRSPAGARSWARRPRSDARGRAGAGIGHEDAGRRVEDVFGVDEVGIPLEGEGIALGVQRARSVELERRAFHDGYGPPASANGGCCRIDDDGDGGDVGVEPPSFAVKVNASGPEYTASGV